MLSMSTITIIINLRMLGGSKASNSRAHGGRGRGRGRGLGARCGGGAVRGKRRAQRNLLDEDSGEDSEEGDEGDEDGEPDETDPAAKESDKEVYVHQRRGGPRRAGQRH